MHRLLVNSQVLESDAPNLPMEAARHLKVLRPENGEAVELFDGAGHSRQYVWRDGVLAPHSNLQTFKPSDLSLTLFACITKGSRWDWTIEKATELGVTRIVPVISDRTIVRIPKAERTSKRERWQRIAEDAARQSDAKWLPEILPAIDFKDSLALVRNTTCFVGALTTPPPPPLAQAIQEKLTATVDLDLDPRPSSRPPLSLFIGPEGDFTPDELQSLLAIATPASFGSTILRAETAAIFAVSVLKAALDNASI